MKCLQMLEDIPVGTDPRLVDTMNKTSFIGDKQEVGIACDPKVNYVVITDRRNGKRVKVYLQ